MPGWFLYFEITLKVWSSVLPVKDSYFKCFEISRLLKLLKMKLFMNSAVSNSVLRDSSFPNKFCYLLPWPYKKMMDLLTSKKDFYQKYTFHLSLQKVPF